MVMRGNTVRLHMLHASSFQGRSELQTYTSSCRQEDPGSVPILGSCSAWTSHSGPRSYWLSCGGEQIMRSIRPSRINYHREQGTVFNFLIDVKNFNFIIMLLFCVRWLKRKQGLSPQLLTPMLMHACFFVSSLFYHL
ncbi:hypothetical protein F5Y01DRAFT_20930 [Xylaria sp. FL0043]|nr:hypothetical protein F5Y01DRAFT_20930 [Xylaria sp. FL0043]